MKDKKNQISVQFYNFKRWLNLRKVFTLAQIPSKSSKSLPWIITPHNMKMSREVIWHQFFWDSSQIENFLRLGHLYKKNTIGCELTKIGLIFLDFSLFVPPCWLGSTSFPLKCEVWVILVFQQAIHHYREVAYVILMDMDF